MENKPKHYAENPGIDIRWEYIATCKHCGAEVWLDAIGRKIIIGGKKDCEHEKI